LLRRIDLGGAIVVLASAVPFVLRVERQLQAVKHHGARIVPPLRQNGRDFENRITAQQQVRGDKPVSVVQVS
jgi:hypothetical protein